MSQTKSAILESDRANTLLNTESPAPMMQGEFDLGAEESFFPLDEQIIAAASSALENGQTHYVDVPGIRPLRDALASYLVQATRADVAVLNVLVTAGMQEARFLTLQLIGQDFGHACVPEVVHPGVLKALGVRPMQVTRLAVDAARRLATIDSIRAALQNGSRLFYLESPSRLTGTVYNDDELHTLADLFTRHDAAVIWDQGFAPWAVGGAAKSLAAVPGMTERVAVIGEAFPGMGLASWYIGYIAASEAWIAPMQSQKQIMAICTSTASQYGALEASKLFAETHARLMEQLAQRRASVVSLAQAAGFEVVAGSVVNIMALQATPESAARLTSAGLRFADGVNFGAPGLFRLVISPAAEQVFKQIT